MAKMIQIPYDYTITLPVATAQAVQKNQDIPISLEALGLLVNLLSYPTSWELHKTELYKRYGKNGRTSVNNAWKDLMAANYIVEFKYRSGKKYEYVYYFRKVPFTEEEKANIIDEATNEHGEVWAVDFVQSKMETPKPTDNKKPLSNKKNLKKEEEEEPITLADVLAFLNEQINKRDITNTKTIKAIYEVADKCKAIGTANKEAMENYCIKVIEEKMVKIGQKQKAAGKKPKDQATEIKPEGREERLEKMVSMRKTNGDVEDMTAEEREAYFKQAEELRKQLEKKEEGK